MECLKVEACELTYTKIIKLIIMTSDFMPIPEIGVKYIKPNGDIIKVTNFYQNNGGVPDYVEYIELSDNSIGEAPMEDWNNLNLKVDIPEPEPISYPEPEPAPVPGPDPEPAPELDIDPKKRTTTDNVIDEKLNQLSLFLNDEPFTKMPFNVPNKILNFDTTEEIPENEIKEDDVIKEIDAQIQAIRDIRDEGRKPERRSSFLNEFLWSCAGVDKPLLRMSSQDHAKKAGMGGTILFTALMAMISGGYAIYTVFQESDMSDIAWAIAIFFGIFWGGLIFNLDRYMVSSMFTDGKPSISLQELVSGLPRIVIAILLGIVISTPLELLVFSGKINEHIQNEVVAASTVETRKVDLTEIDQRIQYCKNNLNSARDEEKNAWEAYNQEVNIGGGGRIAGYGPNAKKKEELWQTAKAKRVQYENQLVDLQGQRDDKISTVQTTAEQSAELDKGLATRIDALLKVTGPDSDLFWPRILIMLLFIALEIMPVLNKMMMSSGKYDDWLDQESDLTSRKIRCEEYNLYNVVRSGKLGSYANEIMGNFSIEKYKDDVARTGSDTIESTIDLEKHNFIKENKLRIEKENQETFMLITAEVSRYLQHKVLSILGDDTKNPQIKQNGDNQDASDDAIKIS